MSGDRCGQAGCLPRPPACKRTSAFFPASKLNTRGVKALYMVGSRPGRVKGLWRMEEMTVVGTGILDLCVTLLGVLEVDSCRARTALRPGLGAKAPHFPHQLAEQIPGPCAGQGPRESPVQSPRTNTEENPEANLGRGPTKRAGCPLPGLPRPDPGQPRCTLCPVLSCPPGAQTLPPDA